MAKEECNRYIISNSDTVEDVMNVFALFKVCTDRIRNGPEGPEWKEMEWNGSPE